MWGGGGSCRTPCDPEFSSLRLMFPSSGPSQLMLVNSELPFDVCSPHSVPYHPPPQALLNQGPVSPSRCLELHPNNLAALMALAVSLTNTGMRNDACEALLRWLRHNPKYKQLLKGKSHLVASPNSQRRMSHAPNLGRHERWSIQLRSVEKKR